MKTLNATTSTTSTKPSRVPTSGSPVPEGRTLRGVLRRGKSEPAFPPVQAGNKWYQIEVFGEMAVYPLNLLTKYDSADSAIHNAIAQAEECFDNGVSGKITVTRHAGRNTTKTPSGVKVASKQILLISLHPDTGDDRKVERLEQQIRELSERLTSVKGAE